MQMVATWLGKNSVRVNNVTPGGYNKHNIKFVKIFWQNPLNRMGRPEDLTGIMIYLMSDDLSMQLGKFYN